MPIKANISIANFFKYSNSLLKSIVQISDNLRIIKNQQMMRILSCCPRLCVLLTVWPKTSSFTSFFTSSSFSVSFITVNSYPRILEVHNYERLSNYLSQIRFGIFRRKVGIFQATSSNDIKSIILFQSSVKYFKR